MLSVGYLNIFQAGGIYALLHIFLYCFLKNGLQQVCKILRHLVQTKRANPAQDVQLYADTCIFLEEVL